MSRASEYRSRKREQLKELYVAETGQTFIVRQVGLDVWIMGGRIPDSLAREVLSAWQQLQDAAQAAENMSVDQMMTGFHFMRDMIVSACVSPRIVIGDVEANAENDEIHFVELEPAERAALLKYCTTGVGARAADGSVTAEAVTNFS